MSDTANAGPRHQIRRKSRTRSRNCPRKLSKTKPRYATTAPSAPTSAMSSGWCGSGRTISAFPPTRLSRRPAPMSARRSARMCSAVSPTCCRRSRAIRRCCSISTTSNRWARNSIGRHQPRQRAQREPRPRDSRAAHARGPQRLLASRRHKLRQRAHRLDLDRSPASLTTAANLCSIKRLHEPGEQMVLGKRYPDTGVAQGRAVLADLARHPATAQHIAQKLARHFVADEPPPSARRQARKDFQGHRRRSQGSRQDAGHRRGILDAGSGPSSSRRRMDRRRAAC